MNLASKIFTLQKENFDLDLDEVLDAKRAGQKIIHHNAIIIAIITRAIMIGNTQYFLFTHRPLLHLHSYFAVAVVCDVA